MTNELTEIQIISLLSAVKEYLIARPREEYVEHLLLDEIDLTIRRLQGLSP